MKIVLVLLMSLFMVSCAGKKDDKKAAEAPSDPKEVVLQVVGMTCSNCERKIENKLVEMEAILEASANHSDSTATIRFDANRIELSEITKVIESGGYQVVEETEE